MLYDDFFVSFDDWYDYIYDAMLDQGIVVDGEFLEMMIKFSIDFLNEQGLIEGDIEFTLDED